MIESQRDFTQVKVEELLRRAAVHVEPMLGVAPEAFDPVDVVAPSRPAALLPDDDVRAADAQAGVSLPVVRVVEAARQSVRDDQAFEFGAPATLYGEDSDDAVALKYAEYDDLARSAPSALARAVAAEHRLIAFDRAFERGGALFGNRDDLAHHAVEPLDGRRARQAVEAQPVSRHAQDEVINQPPLERVAQACRRPRRAHAVARLTAAALEAPVGQLPSPVMSARWTRTAHGLTILLISLVQFA
jgi:hypothetical protein